MNWHGKIIGGAFGFLLGGPLGAMLGAALGHQFDRGLASIEPLLGSDYKQPDAQQGVQMAFFTATFSIMGHLAKADGRVSEAEIKLARSIMEKMELSDHLRNTAARLFNHGKRPDFPLDEALKQFRAECRRYALIRMFIEIQLQAAYADGPLRAIEERLLLYMCDRLDFSRFEFQALKAIQEAQMRFTGAERDYDHSYRQRRSPKPHAQPTLDDAYAVLGVRASASNTDIKRAYRRLMSQHHPDKLVANGLPDEMIKIATEKTQKIRKAYEKVSAARKL